MTDGSAGALWSRQDDGGLHPHRQHSPPPLLPATWNRNMVRAEMQILTRLEWLWLGFTPSWLLEMQSKWPWTCAVRCHSVGPAPVDLGRPSSFSPVLTYNQLLSLCGCIMAPCLWRKTRACRVFIIWTSCPFFKLIAHCFDSKSLLHSDVIKFPQGWEDSFFSFQPEFPTIKKPPQKNSVVLTVTNAPGNGKRADIVFYGLTFETLLFLWWITVCS